MTLRTTFVLALTICAGPAFAATEAADPEDNGTGSIYFDFEATFADALDLGELTLPDPKSVAVQPADD